MNRRVSCLLASIFGIAFLLSLSSSSRTQELPPQPAGVDVQARGPVHEAFAEPDTTDPQQGPIVPKQPPEPIEELPPEQQPEGDNVQWIPGYWSWDADASDFLWVSGCWRAAPPGRRWLPGHWQQVDAGWLWVSGFWAPENLQETQYLPTPPPTLDKGPAAPAPNDNSFYSPGCWVYRDSRFMWRPGQWIAFQPRWAWIPAHYVWTPTGCLFIEDYWDRPMEECGLLFAPCRFDLGVWGRRPWRPEFCVHFDFLLGSLFVGPHRHHYYFGDYFEPAYAKRGFVAWTDFHPVAGVFDPRFAYYRHLHAGEPQWEPALRNLYRGRFTGEVPRPPRTLVQQNQVIKNITVNKTGNVVVNKNINFTHLQNVTALTTVKEMHNAKLTSLGSLSKVKESKIPVQAMKVQNVSKEEMVQHQKVAAQTQDLAVKRREAEAKMLVQGGNPVKHTDAARTVKINVPKAPPPPVMPKVVKTKPPPAVVQPKHEERPIPKYEPPHPPGPPKKDKKDKKE